MVGLGHRSKCFRSGWPACVRLSPVIWCTIASGLALATASLTDTASSPSITTPSAPSRASTSSLAALVVVAVTWCPRATSCGTNLCPRTPAPPAKNTRMTLTLLIPEPVSASQDETARPFVRRRPNLAQTAGATWRNPDEGCAGQHFRASAPPGGCAGDGGLDQVRFRHRAVAEPGLDGSGEPV